MSHYMSIRHEEEVKGGGSAALRPLYSRERDPIPIVQNYDWVWEI